MDLTCSMPAPPRRQLVDVLERYMADLEAGVAPDQQALLAAHPELAEELLPYLDSLRLLHGATREMRPPRPAENGDQVESKEPTARRIGEYQVVREIGRGGMGIVYEAHQESLNRRVALKILPFAAVMDQRQIARFRNEAQAAAQLHHPHIVPVFAVGQERGVYYYAMQYVEGQSLEQAIAELRGGENNQAGNSTIARGAVNGSSTTLHNARPAKSPSCRYLPQGDFFRTVARLGQEAASALQHAHEHGIVHRDIKPSNLLIDREGKLWVTDFGLARIQSDNGVTLTGDVVGTLRYMSPEQAGGSTLVDARTDVYSLGATLYELITQTPAHPGDERPVLLRQIVNDEPISPRRINPAVPIDLETIVLGALAKARDERYTSAQALADDLERFLEGKPTFARRPTLADRMAKWARRHRPLVAVAACAMVLLSVVSAVGLVLLAREQARTSAALADAKQQSRQARSAVDQLGVRLSDRLAEIPGAESVRRDVLIEALGYYRQFANEAGNDPQLRQETALAHFRSAVIAAKLGAIDDAITEYQSAQKLLAELVSAEPQRTEPRAQLAVSHNNLGLLFAGRSETEQARLEYDKAIAIQEKLLREQPQNLAFAGQLAESEANLGLLLDQTGDTSGAERSLRAATSVLRPLADSNLNDPQPARNLAIACNNLSFVLRGHDAAAADKASREAIAILERLAQQPATGDDYGDDLALCYNNRAALASQNQKWEDAIGWHERAIALQDQMARKSPAVVRYRSDLAISLNNLGLAACRAGKTSEADAAFGRARELFSTLVHDYPDELAYRSSLAALLNNQALALAEVGRHADAVAIFPAAIKEQLKSRDRAPDSQTMRDLLSKMYYNFGQSLRAEKRLSEAAQSAIARRELWKGNGERLLGVAAELAEIEAVMRTDRSTPTAERANPNLEDEVLATVQQAYDAGWPGKIDLATEERFAYLKNNERFAAKVAELNERSSKAAKVAVESGAVRPTDSN
jgi:eukaryotic-like serine/threonine-protein kinase